MSNYSTKNTKKKLKHAAGLYTSFLAFETGYIALKAEVNKVEINNRLMIQLAWVIQRQKSMI